MARGRAYFSFTAGVIKVPMNLPWTGEFLNQDKIDFSIVVVVVQRDASSARGLLRHS